MNNPLLFRAVRWRVAGEYAYKGDLIITDGTLYYFPHTDLVEERIDKTAMAAMLILISCGVALIYRFVAPLLVDPLLGRNTPSTIELLQIIERAEGDSTKVREKLDEHIANLKAVNAGSRRNLTLPLPVRFAHQDVKRVSFGLFGALRFDGKYGEEQFHAGLIGRGALRRALNEEGFVAQ
jgi:hypothetical protein